MNPYQYVLLRYRLNASAGEFVNVGVVLWNPEANDLQWRLSSHYRRLSDFFGDFDGRAYRQMVQWFDGRCERLAACLRDPQDRLLEERPQSLSEVMTHLQPEDASCFQWSDVRAGIDRDLEARFEKLWDEFITRYEKSTVRDRVDETRIQEQLAGALRAHGLLNSLEQSHELSGGNYTHVFSHKWLNGHVQVLDAISLDLADSTRILNKAASWAGRLLCLSKGAEFEMTGVVAPPDSSSLQTAYGDALAILREAPSMRQVVPVGEIQDVIQTIQTDMSQHRDGDE